MSLEKNSYWEDQNKVKKQYEVSSNLNKRGEIYKYSSKNFNLFKEVFKEFEFNSKTSILELGGGIGKLWSTNADKIPTNCSIVFSDSSSAMVREAKAILNNSPYNLNSNISFYELSAEDLPFEDNTFDYVVGCQMFYHVLDKTKALHEIKRVLKPNGKLILTTNSFDHLKEIKELIIKFCNPLDVSIVGMSDSFTVENSLNCLSKVFDKIEYKIVSDFLFIDEPSHIVNYVESYIDLENKKEITQFITEIIKEYQFFKLQTKTGIIVLQQEQH